MTNRRLTRSELLVLPCWSCWWKEGGNCYLEGRTQKVGNEIIGTTITKELACNCNGYKNKRAVLSQVIPNEKLVVVSEIPR